MSEYVVYILYSSEHDKTYIGFTSSLINRFRSHNELSKRGWTIKYRPWRVVHVEFFTTKSEAMQREHFLKTGVGRGWMRRNLTF